MIDRGQLMMGDWVEEENSYPMYVDGIFDDVVYLNFKENESDVWEVPYKDLQPIRLTEDLLKKLGFSVHEIHTHLRVLSKENFFIHYYFDAGKLWVHNGEKSCTIGEVFHLHELQNVVRMSTGWEIAGEETF